MLRVLPQITRFLRSNPTSEQYQHAKVALVTNLRNDGAQEGVLRLFEAFIETIATANQEIREDRETYYKIDTYLIGGLGIVSLILLQVLASLGHPDVASSIAWLSLAIALPCIAGFLLLGFLKKDYDASGCPIPGIMNRGTRERTEVKGIGTHGEETQAVHTGVQVKSRAGKPATRDDHRRSAHEVRRLHVDDPSLATGISSQGG